MRRSVAQAYADWLIKAVMRRVIAELSLRSEEEELQGSAQRSRICLLGPGGAAERLPLICVTIYTVSKMSTRCML